MDSSLDREELAQALIDTQRALQAERQRRRELEQLLDGVGPLTAPLPGAGEIFDRLLDVARPLLDFDHAAILEPDVADPEVMVACVATAGPLRDGRWPIGPAFRRVLAGHPIAAFDLQRIDEWRALLPLLDPQTSALQILIPREGAPAMLVCVHQRLGYYTQTHLRLALRLVPLATQALRNMRQVADMRRANTELVHARDEALQSSRAKSTFLATMSHELRTPLNAVLGYADLIEEQTLGDGRDPWFLADLKRVRSAAHHLLGLITDVLDLAKIEAGRATTAVGPVDLGALLDEIEATARPIIAARGNRFTIERHVDGHPRWRTDERKACQILLNLLSNAAKFTTNGTIGLTVRQEGAHLAFTVQDDGAGIAAEDLERIFHAFEQVPSPSRPEGTGLGLTITRRLCEMLGGRVEAESALGVGSRFTAYVALDLEADLARRSASSP